MNHTEIIDAILTRTYGVAPDHLPGDDDNIVYLMACQEIKPLTDQAYELFNKALPKEVVFSIVIRFE